MTQDSVQIKKLAIIIPCYNEGGSIAGLLAELNKLQIPGFQIEAVVVNDASTDNTLAEAKKYDCVILDLPVNLGIGGAVQTGFRYAWRENFDFAVQIDGDGQHPANQLPKMLEAVANDDVDVVIGSRFLRREGFQSSRMRRVGIRILTRFVRLVSGLRIKDVTSGFRLYNRKALAILQENYPDTYPEPEAIVILAKNQIRIKEVAVQMQARTSGQSSIKIHHSVYYMAKVSLAIVFMALKLHKNGKHHSP